MIIRENKKKIVVIINTFAYILDVIESSHWFISDAYCVKKDAFNRVCLDL
jgi:hypothetical protein